jgi:hypothetical protein
MLPLTISVADFRGDFSLINPQHQPFRALATTLSLLTLSACASAVPVSPTTAPAASTDMPVAAPAAPVGAEPPAVAPAVPVVPAALPQAAALVVQGTASVSGAPLAGAQVTVLDAVSNATLAVGGEGLRLESTPGATDAQGGFRIALLGLSEGQLIKVVATTSNRRLEALVQPQPSAATFRVLAEGSFPLDEATTVEAYLLGNLVRVSGVLKPAAAAAVLKEALGKSLARREKLLKTLKAAPNMYGAMTAWTADGKSEKTRQGMVGVLLGNASINQEVAKDMLASALQLSEAAAKAENRQSGFDLKLDDLTLPGTPLKIVLDPQAGQLSVANIYNGAKVDSLSNDGAKSAVLRKPSRKKRSTASNDSQSAVLNSPGQIDDGSQMIVSLAQLQGTAAAQYHNENYSFIGVTFSLAPVTGGYDLTLFNQGGTDRILHFVSAGGDRYRLVGYEAPMLSRTNVAVDPEVGASQPIPDGYFTGVTNSFHFTENDDFVYDIHFSGSKLEGFTLYSPLGDAEFSIVHGAPTP